MKKVQGGILLSSLYMALGGAERMKASALTSLLYISAQKHGRANIQGRRCSPNNSLQDGHNFYRLR